MKIRRFAALFLAVGLIFTAGCSSEKEKDNESIISSGSENVESEEPKVEEKVYINPLTGEKGIDADKVNTRPVAIMINNISIAQKVQCGLNDADIIYETEVEGGVTRLLAVFQDVSKVDRIGSIRSARYAYIDLALGHNAIYCHHGQDPTYAAPHLKDSDHYVIDTNNAGKRISNGLASEHTLYTFGNNLWESLKGARKTENTTGASWLSFADEEEEITLSGGACNNIYVPFSNNQKTTFVYDITSGRYIYKSNGINKIDYITGKNITVKNVFVLMSSITNYPDNYHRKVELTGGDGYYVVNGTYTPIKWSKGKATNKLSFTNTDGSPLTVNAGNSWVCIADKNKSQITIG